MALKQLKFAGQTVGSWFFSVLVCLFAFLLSFDVMDVTVRLMCWHFLFVLSQVSEVPGLEQEFCKYESCLKFSVTFFPLGLTHLIGSSLLRAYMHGFFMDIRLYHKVKKAHPCQFSFLAIKSVCWGFVWFGFLFGFFCGFCDGWLVGFFLQIMGCVLY